MTKEEAQQEAVRRWGADAFAVQNFQLTNNCTVSDHPLHPKHYGFGATWEEAFAKAEGKVNRDGLKGNK